MHTRTSARLLALVASAVLLTGCGLPARRAAESISPKSVEMQFTPVTAETTVAPVPVLGTDGLVHLAYELLLVNTLSQPATIASIKLVADGRTLFGLEGAAVKPWIRVLGGSFGDTVIGPGQQAIVWIDATLPNPEAVPPRFHHVLEVQVAKPAPPLVPARISEVVAFVEVDRTPPVVIGAPLAGAGWLNGNSCCEMTPHRMAVSPINGKLWASERFAIDYVKLDAAGRMVDGDIRKLSSYPSFGEKIHAVADGPVVAMLDDQKESVAGANPVGLAIEQYGGNYVVQDIGGGRFAFYAHLQPGNPLGLKIGQKLRRGQVLGLLGNTGNSDAPHLHFHIMDSPNPLGSNGLPFVIDAFGLDGRVVSNESLEAGAGGAPFVMSPQGSGPRKQMMPLHRDVMSYAHP